MATENVTPRRRPGTFTLALGLRPARRQQSVVTVAGARCARPFALTAAQAYAEHGWNAYDARRSPAAAAGARAGQAGHPPDLLPRRPTC